MVSLENLYCIYADRFLEENNKEDEKINWTRWEALDDILEQLDKMLE